MPSIPALKAVRSPREESTGDLVGGLLSDAKELVSAHGQQLKLEVKSEVASLTETIKLTGIAIAAVVLSGLLLSQAVALGIAAASGLPLWACYGLVGAVLAIAGYVVLRSRPASVDLVPSDALSSIKRDVQRVADAMDP